MLTKFALKYAGDICFPCIMFKSITVLFYGRLQLQERTMWSDIGFRSLVVSLHAIYCKNSDRKQREYRTVKIQM